MVVDVQEYFFNDIIKYHRKDRCGWYNKINRKYRCGKKYGVNRWRWHSTRSRSCVRSELTFPGAEEVRWGEVSEGWRRDASLTGQGELRLCEPSTEQINRSNEFVGGGWSRFGQKWSEAKRSKAQTGLATGDSEMMSGWDGCSCRGPCPSSRWSLLADGESGCWKLPRTPGKWSWQLSDENYSEPLCELCISQIEERNATQCSATCTPRKKDRERG
jgi:hypothetical protein